jgi:hypothetical protein
MLGLFFALSLAHERIVFDKKDCTPRFTQNQIDVSAPAVRDGLQAWASTPRGCETIRRLDAHEYEIEVFEETLDNSTGEAPQPGIATLIAAADHSKVKTYELILNPAFKRTSEILMFTDEPNTPAQLMAAAWAAEMLHVDFYSRGISLPHHSRADFQEEWREIARELGFPRLPHDDDFDVVSTQWRHPRVIFWR